MKCELPIWLSVAAFAIGVAGLLFYLLFQAVEESKMFLLNSHVAHYVLCWIVYFIGGGAGIIMQAFIRRLIMPTEPKNLASLETLEEERKVVDRQGTQVTALHVDPANKLAANELYLKVKCKIGGEARLNILRDNARELNGIVKEDANTILSLFPDEDHAVAAYNVLEPYIMSGEVFRQQLSDRPSTASAASHAS